MGSKAKGPHEDGNDEHEESVEAVLSGLTGVGVDDVARDSPCGEDDLGEEKGGEDGQRGEEAGDGLRAGKLYKMLDTEPFDHGVTSVPRVWG